MNERNNDLPIQPFGKAKRNGYYEGQPLKRRPKANNLRSHRNGAIRPAKRSGI